MTHKYDLGALLDNRSAIHPQLRCKQLEEVITKLANSLIEHKSTVENLKNRLRAQRSLVKRGAQAYKDIEANKGKLEQSYYDIYFKQLAEAQQFNERLQTIRSELSVISGFSGDKLFPLLDQLGTETKIKIPTLKPYAVQRVDLGLSDACSDFCRSHRRRMTSRMGNSFYGTRVNAILDLSEYVDANAYLKAVHTKSKGNVTRESRRSMVLGLVCKIFDPFEHIHDIDAIFQSKPERQAGVLRSPYDQGAAAFLKYVQENHSNHMSSCPRHHNTWYGIFAPSDGRLIGFIMIERHGQFCHYRHIMGHGDWLGEGIMFHLHFAVVEWIYACQPGLNLVSYAQWTDLPDVVDTRPGLTRWKKKALFKPTCLIESLHGTPEELRTEIIENSLNKAFPSYVLESAQSAACLYSAALMGQRDVIHVAQRGIQDVTLVDHDAEMMREMRKAYPRNWDYHVGDAFEFVRSARASRRRFDVVILDPWVYLERANVKMTKTLVGIANQYVLISLTDVHFFRQNHLKPVPADVFRYFHALDERILDVDLLLSTRAFGGLYWVILKIC